MAVKLYGYLKDFSQGINVKDSANLVSEQELVDAENALLGRGFVQKRNGYEVFANAPTQSTRYLWNQFGALKWSEV